MNADHLAHGNFHLLIESDARPIESCCNALAALLIFAGTTPQGPCALPVRPVTAPSGVSNDRF